MLVLLSQQAQEFRRSALPDFLRVGSGYETTFEVVSVPDPHARERGSGDFRRLTT